MTLHPCRFRTRIYCFPSKFIRSQSRKSRKLAKLGQSESQRMHQVGKWHSFTREESEFGAEVNTEREDMM